MYLTNCVWVQICVCATKYTKLASCEIVCGLHKQRIAQSSQQAAPKYLMGSAAPFVWIGCLV